MNTNLYNTKVKIKNKLIFITNIFRPDIYQPFASVYLILEKASVCDIGMHVRVSTPEDIHMNELCDSLNKF